VTAFLECWHHNYQPLFGDRLAQTFDRTSATAQWQEVLAQNNTWVADVDELGVIGVSRVVLRGPAAEIGSLYVSPRAQGRGVGKVLLEVAVDHCEQKGIAHPTLWVFTGNAPTIRFYQRLGWETTGKTRIEAMFEEPELEMVWPGARPFPRPIA